MRSLVRVALAIVIAGLFGTALPSVQAQSNLPTEAAPVEPELFDLALAKTNLESIHTEIDRLRTAIDDALEDVDGLTIERDFIDLNHQARNSRLQESRTRARNMAVRAYMGIGPPTSGAIVLDAATANDLNFRRGLLRQQAALFREQADTYSWLAGQADSTVLGLVDSINDRTRQVEGLSRTLTRELAKVEHAEWLVSIASIHHQADLAFARTRRAEPTPDQWRQLRDCESTELYEIDTGNTFYGAYQFTWQTWTTVGGDGNPALAPPEEQDARARLLYARRGAQPWPICGRFLPRS